MKLVNFVNNESTKLENNVTEIINFILKNYNKNKILLNTDICSELILIIRILNQRFIKSKGFKIKEYKAVNLLKKKILREINDDEYYDLIKNFITNYRQFKNKNLNSYNVFKKKRDRLKYNVRITKSL